MWLLSKTVVDFSKMGDQQIKDYFLQKSEQKTCGRFNSKQLNQPILLSVPPLSSWGIQLTPLRKFAAALFLVFGTGLFSCTTSSGQTVGEISVNQTDENTQIEWNESVVGKMAPIIIGDTIADEQPDTTKIIQKAGEVELWFEGDVDFSVFEITDTTVEINQFSVTTQGMVLTGKPEIVIKTIKGDIKIENSVPEICGSELLNLDSVYLANLSILGGFSHSINEQVEEVEQFDVDENPKKINSNSQNGQLTKPNLDLSVKVFPNPAKQFFNLEFTIPKSGRSKIRVVAMDGKQVVNSINKRHEEGKYIEQIDVSNLPNGVYFYTISTKEYSHSGKIIISK